MGTNFNSDYHSIASIENLFEAWHEFQKGKKNRIDVQLFGRNIEDNLFSLQTLLSNKNYGHGKYESFYVNDPKQRHIHKAAVVDRIIHHLLYKYLYWLFDKTFIYDSYSCRLDKGTHRGVKRLEYFARKVSANYRTECWALKCDIRKFFASIDHEILTSLISAKVNDENILWLIKSVVKSFFSEQGDGKGMPLGNLTSQIFSNIYLNELDQFVKHDLKVKHYIRYADDFLILSTDRAYLFSCINTLRQFLSAHLKLELHPQKMSVRKLTWGIDFLGYVVLPHYTVPRTKTKRRMYKKLEEARCKSSFNQSLQSYLGYLKHANSYKIMKKIRKQFV